MARSYLLRMQQKRTSFTNSLENLKNIYEKRKQANFTT